MVHDGVLRCAGTGDMPVLWLVHALGDSSLAYVPLFSTSLSSMFELIAPDLPGSGLAPLGSHVESLDGLAEWLVETIRHRTPVGRIGIVGHSLGASVAVKTAPRLSGRVVGVFSIEGNLTESDAYLSGQAMGFKAPEAFRDHLLREVRAMADAAAPARRVALWRYHASLACAASNALWALGRSASAASTHDGLGAEYRSLSMPSLYYWSPDNTAPATQEYLRSHQIRNCAFSGGRWPMIENPEQTAREIGAFFEPLFLKGPQGLNPATRSFEEYS